MIWANMASKGGWEGGPWSKFGDRLVGVASPYPVPLEYWPCCVGGEESKPDMADATGWTRAGLSYKVRRLRSDATVVGRLLSASARTVASKVELEFSKSKCAIISSCQPPQPPSQLGLHRELPQRTCHLFRICPLVSGDCPHSPLPYKTPRPLNSAPASHPCTRPTAPPISHAVHPRRGKAALSPSRLRSPR
jgi:hypothetical protein